MDAMFLEKSVHLHPRRKAQHLPHLPFRETRRTVAFEGKRFAQPGDEVLAPLQSRNLISACQIMSYQCQ